MSGNRGEPFVNPTFFDNRGGAESLAQPRPSLNVHIRLVDNGALIFLSGSHAAFPATQAQPERVATSVDQAIEQIREVLAKIWPVQR